LEHKASCLGERIGGVSFRIDADRRCLKAIAEKLIRATRGLILPQAPRATVLAKNYVTIVIPTGYWKPGHDYLMTISHAVASKLQIGDILVLSEKAISVATGRIVDETKIKPGMTARVLARFWMRLFWGYLLAPICRLSRLTTKRLRSYPLREGAAHKQLALSHVGFLEALRHGSEGGIDVSNLPYSYASLPLEHPDEVAMNIFETLRRANPIDMTVLIVDSDKTYTWRNIHICPRSTTIEGIAKLGLLAYAVGRAFRLRPRSTPVALAGKPLSVEEALRAAALANKARGSGSGRTAWDMAERFGVGLTEVTWESLTKIKHRPIVIVRRISR